MYEKLADNGVGAIITGMVGVDENSRAAPVMVKAYGATFVPELTKLADRVRGLGAKLIVQINHCGLKARQIDGRRAVPRPLRLAKSAGKSRQGNEPRRNTRDGGGLRGNGRPLQRGPGRTRCRSMPRTAIC